MSKSWIVNGTGHDPRLPVNAMFNLLDASCDAAPAGKILAFLNHIAPVEYLSLVGYRNVPQQPPELVEGHARTERGRDVTAACFSIYRRQYWRSDETTHIADQFQRCTGDTQQVMALHFHPGDIPLTGWRSEIYDRENLSDRLSFIYSPLPQTVFALNLYRDDVMGRFQPAEIEHLLSVGLLLRRTHQSALRVQTNHALAVASLPVRMDAARSAIKKVGARLSPRELEVCSRIACGVSADGIAAELDVAPSTVVTLRKRAYAKLAEAGLRGGRLSLAGLARQA